MGVDDELAQLAGELEGIAERLADVALDRLRAAVDPDEPDPGAVALERKITRARRAVEKAANLLDPSPRFRDDDDTN
jgi:hypothetical protein